MRTEDFLMYQSGILTARLTFAEGEVRQSARSLVDDTFLPEERLEGSGFRYPAIHELWASEAWTRKWAGDVVIQGSRRFEKNDVRQDPRHGAVAVYAQTQSGAPVDVVVHGNRPIGFILSGRNESVLVVKGGYEAAAGLSAWTDGSVSGARHGIEERGTLMVPMADGVRLATDVVLPAPRPSGRIPAVLVRTCYGRCENRELWLKYARRGYAVVVQDVRGRYDSEGDWQPFEHEMADGSDTLDWIAAQEWSDGGVGMIGGSYLGFVQWAAAASGNPHLKAIVSQVAAGSAFVDLPKRGGALSSGILAWCFMIAGRRNDAAAMARSDWDQLLKHRPIREIPERGLGRRIPFFDRWMEHEDEDDFWRRSDWSLRGERIDVPALYVSGWFDDDGPGTFLAWGMNRRNRRANQRMILGPWLHKTNSSRRIHGIDLERNALKYDLDRQYLRWFDRFLKDMDNGVDREDAVEYYMLGENAWRTSCQWPPAGTSPRELYLGSLVSARSAEGDGTLALEAPAAATFSEFVSDPANPFPYLIDVSENECAVPADYSGAEAREDVLVYTSEPLEEALAIAGAATARFFASSSRPDTDWIVRLCDLEPGGRSIKLADGILRARYRRAFGEPEPLEPGRTESYDITLTNVAHTFLPGHRIRVQIASGAASMYFPNSQTGGKESDATLLLEARQRVYHGGAHASSVTLPVLARDPHRTSR